MNLLANPLKIQLLYDLAIPFWVYIWRKPQSEKTHAPQSSLQNYLQQPGPENNLIVHGQRNGHRRCTTYIQWNIIQAQKGQNNASCSNMDSPSNCLSECDLLHSVWQTSYGITSMWNLGSDGEESACSAQDPGLILGLGRSSGEGHGYPLQYSCLGNPMDRGA